VLSVRWRADIEPATATPKVRKRAGRSRRESKFLPGQSLAPALGLRAGRNGDFILLQITDFS
jgi:hypothetical protein